MKEGIEKPTLYSLVEKDQKTLRGEPIFQIVLIDQASQIFQNIFRKVGQKTIMRVDSQTGNVLTLEGNFAEMNKAEREINYLLRVRPNFIRVH